MNHPKNEILQAGLTKQESIIADFRRRIANVTDENGGSCVGECDNNYRTFSAETLSELNILNNEIAFANQELEEMKRINCDREHEAAEYGAIVKTNKKTFFVSASLEDFAVNGNSYFGISVYSPLYVAMKGKKPGERFQTRNVEYVIEDVF